MRIVIFAILLCLPVLALAATSNTASKSAKSSQQQPPGRKVDKPIPETYQPLTGPRWSNTYSDVFTKPREREREKEKSASHPSQQKQQEKFNIQAPTPAPAHKAPPPKIEETGNNLSIHDPN